MTNPIFDSNFEPHPLAVSVPKLKILSIL